MDGWEGIFASARRFWGDGLVMGTKYGLEYYTFEVLVMSILDICCNDNISSMYIKTRFFAQPLNPQIYLHKTLSTPISQICTILMSHAEVIPAHTLHMLVLEFSAAVFHALGTTPHVPRHTMAYNFAAATGAPTCEGTL